jgi:hypothetical protein
MSSNSSSSSSELYQRQPLLANGSAFAHANGSAIGLHHYHQQNHVVSTGQTSSSSTWVDDIVPANDLDDDDEEEIDVDSEATRILIDDDDGLSPEAAGKGKMASSPQQRYARGDVESGVYSAASTGKGHYKSSSLSDYSAFRDGPQRDATKLDLPPPKREEYKFPKDRVKTFIGEILLAIVVLAFSRGFFFTSIHYSRFLLFFVCFSVCFFLLRF